MAGVVLSIHGLRPEFRRDISMTHFQVRGTLLRHIHWARSGGGSRP